MRLLDKMTSDSLAKASLFSLCVRIKTINIDHSVRCTVVISHGWNPTIEEDTQMLVSNKHNRIQLIPGVNFRCACGQLLRSFPRKLTGEFVGVPSSSYWLGIVLSRYNETQVLSVLKETLNADNK